MAAAAIFIGDDVTDESVFCTIDVPILACVSPLPYADHAQGVKPAISTNPATCAPGSRASLTKRKRKR